ncbi:MAG: deoxyribose-phosphate aldolase [Wenzhouxiangella sp.]|nr:deoxyribose-phosphate aldolase [Wenzhouxiangella sp.]
MTSLHEVARQTLALVDLTRLETDDTEADIESLCRRAGTSFGPVAAVCVYPRFVATARRALAGADPAEEVRIATVVNFPRGEDDAETVVEAIRAALAAGADEIDLVFPWRELRAGNDEPGRRLVSAAREACGEHVLKVILETGELTEADLIRRAARIAIESGADFLKTSTGKVPVNATPEAVRILLEAIRDSGRDVGCKVSGGIRTTRQAREYLGLAARIMGPDWISPSHFRFGASGLLDDLMATLGDSQAPAPDKDAY